MRAARTLKARVVLSTGAVLLATLAMSAWIVDHHVRRISIRALDDQLEIEAEALATLLRFDGGQLTLSSDEDTLRTFSSKRDDAFFQIVTPSGVVERSQSLGAAELEKPEAKAFEPLKDPRKRRVDHDTIDAGPRGEPVRVATVVISAEVVNGDTASIATAMRRPIAIQVARTLAAPDKAREEVVEAFGIAIPLALVLGVFGVFLVAWRALRPIARMSREAESIGRGAPVRLEVDRIEGELRALGTTLNGAFDRLGEAVQRERRFSADVAHELRTPLAVLKSRIELALQRDRTPDEYKAALATSLESCQRVERVANDMLLLARTEAAPPRADRFDLRVVVAHALESVRAVPSLPRTPIRLSLPEAEIAVTGNETLFERMVANLIENALRHGGDDIEVIVTTEGGTPVLRVQDRGPGFSADLLGRAFQRFARGDASRSRDTGGAGLGLAIVQAIARAHGGTAEVKNREGGGAEMTVRFSSGAE